MISLKFKPTFTIALISFVIGCCATFLLTSNCSSQKDEYLVVREKALKAQADSLHSYFEKKIMAVESRNEELSKELQSTKSELNKAKSKTSVKGDEIKKLIRPIGFPAKKLLEKSTSSTFSNDSDMVKCDSLVQLVSDYMQENDVKDSLYEAQIIQQDSLIAGKDAVIILKENENLNISILLKQSISEQTALEHEIAYLEKKIKHQKVKGKLFTLGTAILTGFVTHYLSK